MGRRYSYQTCKDCAHWERVGENFIYTEGFGECRRQAPNMVIGLSPPSAVWPMVTVDKWCGEFDYKEG